ncbi:MAG: hypothetical protein Kow0031_41600 [Anaerolineae bacterium]
MPKTTITPATPADSPAIERLLRQADLPADDFAAHLPHFWVARHNGAVVAAIGLEPYGDVGLLRSLVVAAEWRGQGLAARLCRQMFDTAAGLGIERLYLLTTTAADYFPRLGFRVVERDSAPPALQTTTEFASLCPASAVCMALDTEVPRPRKSP